MLSCVSVKRDMSKEQNEKRRKKLSLAPKLHCDHLFCNSCFHISEPLNHCKLLQTVLSVVCTYQPLFVLCVIFYLITKVFYKTFLFFSILTYIYISVIKTYNTNILQHVPGFENKSFLKFKFILSIHIKSFIQNFKKSELISVIIKYFTKNTTKIKLLL